MCVSEDRVDELAIKQGVYALPTREDYFENESDCKKAFKKYINQCLSQVGVSLNAADQVIEIEEKLLRIGVSFWAWHQN